ncbi:zinc finger protein castor homolog 1-like [Saccostrea cucullata]|uniref:zinc finger protein castor homolog 1-like n=1 Tax=Saccostrea cuccullata TaxID=36930 RepID=UPI002ED349A4
MTAKVKVRTLDAICAKLKSINGEEHSEITLKKEEDGAPITNEDAENHPNDTSVELDNAKILKEVEKENDGRSSRRKSRKASAPRNIAQVREILDKFECADDGDELAGYEINNQNTDFPPEVEEDTSLEEDDSSSRKEDLSKSAESENNSPVSVSIKNSFHSRKQSRKPRKSTQAFSNKCNINSNSTAPLDLSIAKSAEDSSNNAEKDVQESNQSSHVMQTSCDQRTNSNVDSANSQPKPTSPKFKVTEKTEKQEMTVLKDFAESTMNELLSMYGFSGGSAESVIPQIPSNNFTSNLILHEQTSPDVPKLHVNKAIPPLVSSTVVANNVVTTSPPSLTSAEKKGIFTNFVNQSPNKSTQPPKNIKSPNVEVIKDDKFTNSAAYIKAVFNNQSPGSPSPIKHPGLPDYSKYLKRFSSGTDCKIKYCKELGYREHFHCMDCNFRVFVKKEEMVRHYKWHRKREESLQHGFMRYSPLDDCCQKYGSCTHNGRQTHYHCLQPGCDKVYISTSDVQMHANYHRKDSAIIQEGFQRFRATEDCGTPMCAFYGQRTTHFHCRRPGCNFTFKNKADMEKHKTYHQKDEVLGRDGFKKFMKYEHCGYIGCRYSKLSNHIHCIRPGCIYVLHSTAQLFSHKRKHERRDFETAYRKFREDSTDMDSSMQFGGGVVGENSSFTSSPLSHMSLPISIKTEITEDDFKEESCDSKIPMSEQSMEDSNSDVKSLKSDCSDTKDISQSEEEAMVLSKHADQLSGEKLNDSLTLPIPGCTAVGESPGAMSTPIKSETGNAIMPNAIPGMKESSPKVPLPISVPPMLLSKPSPNTQERKERDESWKNYLIRYTANDPCNSRCQYLYKDHYHCRVDGCLVLFKSKDGVREHARFHELQDRITPVAYTMYTETEACPENCQYSGNQRHYHCIWSGCTHVVPHEGPTFGRLEHYRIHEYARSSAGKTYKTSPKSTEDTPRKRGRPPKYPRNTIPVIPKVELTESEMLNSSGEDPTVINGFKKFEENNPCPDELCLYRMKEHYHCARPRCYQATDRLDVLNLHAKDFHSFVTIYEGFEFFDRNVNCRRPHCHNNKANRHFHCVRPKCDYSFVRHSTMIQHNKKHEQTETPSTSKEDPPLIPPSETISTAGFIPIAPADAKAMIKTSGTFYPLSSIASGQSGQMPSVPAIDSTIFHPMSVSGALTALPMVSAAIAPTMLSPGLLASAGHPLPLAVLLQQGGNPIPQPSWIDLKNKMHYGLEQNCGRPFCKLKKKDHYHCFECNQAFSDMNRVKAHVSKHGLKFGKNDTQPLMGKTAFPITIAPKPDQTPMATNQDHVTSDPEKGSAQESDDEHNSLEGELNASDSLNLNPSTFSNLIAKAQKAHSTSDLQNNNLDADDDEDGKLVISEAEGSNNIEEETMDENSFETSADDSNMSENITSISKRSGRKRVRTKHNDFVDSGEIVVKQRRISSGSASSKSNKDDSIPDGYIRVRHKDDCQFVKCAYRQGITHFHCRRPDCGYSFSDRSRLIQHTLRHERIDSLTGGEMQQFRMNQPCGRDACEFEGKASHFHCLKCNYNCTDSSKVLTHRKYHAKLDNINSQGFQKFGVGDKCEVAKCPYELKQTHYHCMKSGCNYAVLGPAQIASHNIKHANDSL